MQGSKFPHVVGAAFVLAVAVFVTAAGAGVHAHRPSIAAQRALAQRRVLAVLGRNWNAKRIEALVDPRTRLARDGTQVMCYGTGHSRRAAARGSFTCLVRPSDTAQTARLWLSYRALAGRRFRVHWLAYTGA